MHHRRRIFGVVITGVTLLLVAVHSQTPAQPVISTKPMPCKEFPVPVYPANTSAICESNAGPPLNQTAYIDTADAVDKVVAFYNTKVQSTGWTVEPMEGEEPTRAVVKMKKGNGYASAVINGKASGKGTRIQLHAYPNGN